METVNPAAQSLVGKVTQDNFSKLAAANTNLRDAMGAFLKAWGHTEPELDATPSRWLSAFAEMTAGYDHDPAKILSTVFPDDCDQMVWLRNIQFTSLCEHHLLPFMGTVSVCYVPNGKVVGLSKLARVVVCYSRRLQIQERLTKEIAQAIETHLKPLGVGVLIRAHHGCMSCRGVKQPSTEMLTSCLLGCIKSEKDARAEFLQYA